MQRKLADETFRRQVRAARATLTERACGSLTTAGLEAARVLAELLAPGRPPAVRLAAAKTVLEVAMKLREVVDLDTQVADLERRLDEQEATSPAGPL